MSLRLLGLGIGFLFLISSYLQAEPLVSIEYADYSIQGKQWKEIQRGAQKNTNLHHLDGVLPGSSWLIRWKYEYEEKNKLCHLEEVSTHVEISRKRPIWDSSYALNEMQQKMWDDYLLHVKVIEQAQQDLVIHAAKEIETKMKRIKPQKTCSDLGLTANLVGQGVLAKYRGLEIRSDIQNRLASASEKSLQ